MDDTTMKVGLLMEAAHAQQRSAAASLKKLKAVANDLAGIVREEVRNGVIEEFQSLAADSKRASDALHEVQRTANVRGLVWSVGITTLCSAIPLVMTCWIIPSRGEIAALRAKHDELATKIASLEERGGRIDLRRCGDGARLCVRVDRKAPTYGEQSDYLVVRGY
jgi:pyruvate-formate lyase